MADGKEFDIVELSEEEATKRLAVVYLDPEAIKSAMKETGEARAEALSSFVKQTNDDGALAKALRKNPVGVLTDQGLLAPFDELTVQYGPLVGGANTPRVLEGPGIPGHRPRCHEICWQDVEFLGWHWVTANDLLPFWAPQIRLVWHCRLICV